MSRTFSVAFVILLFLASACPESFGQRRRAGRGTAPDAGAGSAASYRRAVNLLEASIEAHGGRAAMRAAEDVSLKGVGHSFARNQSVRVEPPFDRMEHEECLYADVRRNRYIFENRDPLPGGFVFGGRVVINGGQAFFANPRDRTVSPINPAGLPGVTLNYVRRVPHLLLTLACEMLIAYLPQEKLVFQGDLFNLPTHGRWMPSTVNDTTLHFYDALGRLGLSVERIAAVHGPSTTLEDLRRAVERKRKKP